MRYNLSILNNSNYQTVLSKWTSFELAQYNWEKVQNSIINSSELLIESAHFVIYNTTQRGMCHGVNLIWIGGEIDDCVAILALETETETETAAPTPQKPEETETTVQEGIQSVTPWQ